jgi:UDP-N-acetylmuramate dehydrogenase
MPFGGRAGLAGIMLQLWELGLPWEGEGDLVLLGGGSNVLISDEGVRGVVVLNRARQVRFEERTSSPVVWCESGANLGLVARQSAARGLAGLEWAAGIPGSAGGHLWRRSLRRRHGREFSGGEILHQGLWGLERALQREEVPADRLALSIAAAS